MSISSFAVLLLLLQQKLLLLKMLLLHEVRRSQARLCYLHGKLSRSLTRELV